MRRYLIIAGVLVTIVVVGVLVYFYFFKKPAVTTFPGLPGAGDTVITPPGGGDDGTVTLPSEPTAVSSRLVKISAGPVVPGVAVLYRTGDASTTPPSTSLGTGETQVNFIERKNGNVFSYRSSTKALSRTSNKTIPGIQSASWLPDGSLAFVRYLSGTDFSTINTYGLPADSSGKQGFFLPQNLTDIAVSSTSVLALASGVNGSVATLSRPDGTQSSSVFTSPLSALRVSFAGKAQYLVFTKPSGVLAGSTFLVDGKGNFSRIFGPADGLVALASPSGKWILVSYTVNSTLRMVLVDTVSHEALPLPIATITDKCVWSSDDSVIYCGIPVNPPTGASYPDSWYQGVTHFSDRIWKIETSGRYTQLVLDFSKETDEALDATALALDATGSTLVFLNKNDGSLWGYSL